MKKSILFALSLLLVLALSACQPTPTQAIVKGKNLDKMIENATKTQPPGTTNGTATSAANGTQANTTKGANGKTIADIMGAQKTVVKELVDAKGKVKIHVNADVQVPDASGVTVQRVEQEKITQAQVDTLLQHLMKGELFSGNDFKKSKSEIQNDILKIQAAIANGGNSKNPKGGKQFLQYQLDDLKKQLETAPDTSTKTPSNCKLGRVAADMGSGDELFALSQSGENVYQSFHVYNYDDGICFLNFSSEKNAFAEGQASFSTKEKWEAAFQSESHTSITQEELDVIPDIKITKDDARKMADELVAALGLQDLACVSQDKEYGGNGPMTADLSAFVNPRKCVWFLRYARAVNGIPVTYTEWDCMKVEQDNQSSPWGYEDMTFAIDDSGIVGFSWRSPYKVTGTITETSNVMSFSDAMNVFDTMAPIVNAWDGISEGNPNLKNVDIKIDHIRFGLTRVTEQDKRNSGLLVPCWDFFGTMTYISEVNSKTQTMDDGPIPLLTINAIDGSIINRSLGY
jgi:hypothetical protein